MSAMTWTIVSVAIALFFLTNAALVANAAPYTIRTDVEHPYDADWPDVYLIVSTKCVGCHRPNEEITDFTSYEAFVSGVDAGGAAVIVPGQPEQSLLWQQVRWNHAASTNSLAPVKPAMPPDPAEWLTANQQAVIRRWITNGALEYKLPQTCSTRPLLEIDFPSAKECKICHPVQYEQWSRSMHHYAQHSPVFEAFNLTLQERTSGTLGTFCSRCHTPLGTALGENGSRRNVNRSRLSMEGISCVVCHRIEKPYYKSNTRRAIKPGKVLEGCMYGPFDATLPPGVASHKTQKNLHIKSSAFCGACHDVTSPQGVRLEEAYSEWQNSPAAKEEITCQLCHMGPVQGQPIAENQRPWGRAAIVPGINPETLPMRPLSDHTFAGPDYSLLPDTEFPEKLDWMYEVDYRHYERLTEYQKSTLNVLRRANRRQLQIAAQKRYELLTNAASISVASPTHAETGDTLRVDVNVTSNVAGHNFPTGFTAERQAWLEVTLLDPLGRRIYSSGDLDENFDLRDEHSHLVARGRFPHDRHLVNFQSKFVSLATRGTERSVIIPVNRQLDPLSFVRPAVDISASYGRPLEFRVSKGSIPPLASVGNTYAIRLPDQPGNYRLIVRLNYRHLPPVLFDKVGVPHLKHLLEVVVIDESSSIICVSPD